MKIRHGFVSNSSTTSFIVTFPRAPQDVSDVYEMLFKDEEFSAERWDWETNEATLVGPYEIAENVFSMMHGCNLNELFEQRGHLSKFDAREDYEALYAMKTYESLKDGEVMYQFNIGNEGACDYLESADAFRNLPHRAFSHH